MTVVTTRWAVERPAFGSGGVQKVMCRHCEPACPAGRERSDEAISTKFEVKERLCARGACLPVGWHPFSGLRADKERWPSQCRAPA